MAKTKLIYIVFLLISAGQNIFAQINERPKGDQMLWGTYYLKLNINDQFNIQNIFVNQAFLSEGFREKKVVNHLMGQFRAENNMFFGLGFTYSNNWFNKIVEEGTFSVSEWRIFEEIGYRGEFKGGFNSISKFRIEQRFFHNENGNDLLPGFHYVTRFRFSQTFTKDIGRKFTGKLSNSTFFSLRPDLNNITFDFNRLSLGLVYHFTDNFGVGTEYIFSANRRLLYDKLALSNIFRLAFLHEIDLKKNKK